MDLLTRSSALPASDEARDFVGSDHGADLTLIQSWEARRLCHRLLHSAFGQAGRSIASRHGDPNQVVSASRNPVAVPSPTQAMYPSGLISTAAGAATRPRTGSSQLPAYLAVIS